MTHQRRFHVKCSLDVCHLFEFAWMSKWNWWKLHIEQSKTKKMKQNEIVGEKKDVQFVSWWFPWGGLHNNLLHQNKHSRNAFNRSPHTHTVHSHKHTYTHITSTGLRRWEKCGKISQIREKSPKRISHRKRREFFFRRLSIGTRFVDEFVNRKLWLIYYKCDYEWIEWCAVKPIHSRCC